MRESLVATCAGEGWSVALDTTHAPEYVVVTLEGPTSLARSNALGGMVDAARPRVELPSGHLCPFIIVGMLNPPPPASVLGSLYEVIDKCLMQISCMVCVLPPSRLEDPQIWMALEAMGLLSAPNAQVVGSVEEGVRVVRDYSARYGSTE